METTRNRAAVLAKFLRASVRALEDNAVPSPLEANSVTTCTEALASIAAVADELETAAAMPDPVP
jgi:hypothetical protein